MDFKKILQNICDAIEIRLLLIRASIVNTFHQDTAYPAENWSNLLSTFFYTLTFFAFINILYSDVELIAGYTRDQMLFFFLIGQIAFYLQWPSYYGNLLTISKLINNGNLDLILTKPVPSAFYVSTRKISLLQLFRDGTIPIVLLTLSINWSNINVTGLNFICGIIMLVIGFIISYCIFFISVMTSFWLGRDQHLLGISQSLHDCTVTIPYEGLDNKLRFLLGGIVPLLFEVGIPTSIFLGKSDPGTMVLLGFAVMCIFLILKVYLWTKGLMVYNSASS